MNEVMLSYGGLHFKSSTLPYQTLNHSLGFRWSKHERLGQMPGLQFSGPATETLSLSVEIPTDSKNRFDALEELKKMASEGVPKRLISGGGFEGQGANLGMWVIESIDIQKSEFMADGLAMVQKIDLKLSRHEELS